MTSTWFLRSTYCIYGVISSNVHFSLVLNKKLNLSPTSSGRSATGMYQITSGREFLSTNAMPWLNNCESFMHKEQLKVFFKREIGQVANTYCSLIQLKCRKSIVILLWFSGVHRVKFMCTQNLGRRLRFVHRRRVFFAWKSILV